MWFPRVLCLKPEMMRPAQCEGVRMKFDGEFVTTNYRELSIPRWTTKIRMKGVALFRISAGNPRS